MAVKKSERPCIGACVNHSPGWAALAALPAFRTLLGGATGGTAAFAS